MFNQYIINKIESYYKTGDLKSVVRESKKININKIESKDILYIVALAHDQTALKENKTAMIEMQRLAKKYASIIIKKFPSWDKGYFVMGIILQHSGKAKIALKFYENAQKINPKNASYYLSLGNGYRAIKNYKVAEYWYKKALKIKDIKHLGSVNLVSLYEETGNKKLITKYAKKSLELLKNKEDRFSMSQKERMENITK